MALPIKQVVYNLHKPARVNDTHGWLSVCMSRNFLPTSVDSDFIIVSLIFL